MFNTTNLYKRLIQQPGRRQMIGGTITLADGVTIDLTPRNVSEGGLEVSTATSQQGTFTLGAAVIGELSLALINHERQFETADFTGAIIRPTMGLLTQQKWDGTQTIEQIPLGVYTVDDADKTNSTVTISALDNMEKFERPYSDSDLTYPATLMQIVSDACAVCGVALATPDFPGSGYTVAQRPDEENITFREIVSYAAQLAGCYTYCNRDGALVVGWYDLSTTPYQPVGVQSSDVAAADIMITGVQIIPKDSNVASVKAGTEGYIVKIDNNPLAQDNLQDLVDTLAEKLIGFSFRPYTIECLSDPSLDVGDTIRITDRHGRQHVSLVSNIVYTPDGTMTVTADAESKLSNASTRFTAAEKLQEQVNKVEDTVTKQGTEISQNKQEIELKAYKDQIIATINISPETIKIKANRLEITGFVSFDDLENEGSTTINGANITTGRIESADGDWWLDLESGEVYLSKGTFSGEIRWGDDNYIEQNRNGDTIISAANDVTILIGGKHGKLNVAGDVTCDSVDCFHVYGSTVEADELHAANGYTGEVGITRSDGSKRTMEFRDGIFLGYV